MFVQKVFGGTFTQKNVNQTALKLLNSVIYQKSEPVKSALLNAKLAKTILIFVHHVSPINFLTQLEENALMNAQRNIGLIKEKILFAKNVIRNAYFVKGLRPTAKNVLSRIF